MNRLQRWLSRTSPNTDRDDYQPLAQVPDALSSAGSLERYSSYGETGPSYRDPTGHLHETECLPVHHFGIELHPDTAALLEDDDALARDFGGSTLRDFFSGRLVLICAFSACLGGLLFGFDQGLLSIVLVMPQFLRTFPEIDPDVSSGAGFSKGLMTAMLELGAFLGALMAGFLADKYSRRISIAIGLVWFAFGSVTQTLSSHYTTLVVGRTLGGIGVGLLSSTAPMYVAEIAPPNIRGTLLVVEQFMIVFGIVVMFYITYTTRSIVSDWSYRIPFLLQIAPGILLAGLLLILPFSPRWLAGQGRDRECLEVLVRLRGMPASDPRVQAEWLSIRTEAIHSREAFLERHPGLQGEGFKMDIQREITGWIEMFSPAVVKRTQVGVGVMFFQQFVGINALIYYSPTLFETLGLDYEMRLTLSGVMNVIQLIAVLFSLVMFEKLGRKTWLYIGSFGMTTSHVVVAFMIGKYSYDWHTHVTQAWIGVAFIFTFMFAYGISFGPVAWVLPGEVHTSSYRAKGVALAVCSNWVNNFIIGLVTPPMVERTGFGAFVFFAVFAAVSGIWVFFVVPETRGKSLEQMDAVFQSPTGKKDAMAKSEIRQMLLYGR